MNEQGGQSAGSSGINVDFDLAQLDETIGDARRVKAELDRRGWLKGMLLELNPDDGFAKGRCVANGAVCMTGAVGVVVEAAEFLEYAYQNNHADPFEWEWSPRALRLIRALLACAGWGHNFPRSIHPVSLVVRVNDGMRSATDAVQWLDETIAHLERLRPENQPGGRQLLEEKEAEKEAWRKTSPERAVEKHPKRVVRLTPGVQAVEKQSETA